MNQLVIEYVDIDEVIPYARNPRNNDGAIAKVAASIKEYGWKQPIVVDSEMVIVVGDTRHKAAKSLRMKKVPIVRATDLTPAQIKAYRIADNRVHEEASWDHELLNIEIGELKDEGFSLLLTGFDAKELEKMLDENDPAPIDGAQELAAEDFAEFTHTCPKCGFGFNE